MKDYLKIFWGNKKGGSQGDSGGALSLSSPTYIETATFYTLFSKGNIDYHKQIIYILYHFYSKLKCIYRYLYSILKCQYTKFVIYHIYIS